MPRIMYFPTKAALRHGPHSHGHQSIGDELNAMATEFETRAEEMELSHENYIGHLTVLGKRIGESFELEWAVYEGVVYFRDADGEHWVLWEDLCSEGFDYVFTRSVFVEAVHSALWWTLNSASKKATRADIA